MPSLPSWKKNVVFCVIWHCENCPKKLGIHMPSVKDVPWHSEISKCRCHITLIYSAIEWKRFVITICNNILNLSNNMLHGSGMIRKRSLWRDVNSFVLADESSWITKIRTLYQNIISTIITFIICPLYCTVNLLIRWKWKRRYLRLILNWSAR